MLWEVWRQDVCRLDYGKDREKDTLEHNASCDFFLPKLFHLNLNMQKLVWIHCTNKNGLWKFKVNAIHSQAASA